MARAYPHPWDPADTGPEGVPLALFQAKPFPLHALDRPEVLHLCL